MKQDETEALHSHVLRRSFALLAPRAQIRCYDHDVLGPPDLIGCVKLGSDAILAMVRTVTTAAKPGLRDLSTADASPGVTWLELMPEAGDDVVPAVSTATMSVNRERNPFDSLGDVAIELTATRPLPSSVHEYGLAKEGGLSTSGSRGIAEAGVMVSVTKTTVFRCLP